MIIYNVAFGNNKPNVNWSSTHNCIFFFINFPFKCFLSFSTKIFHFEIKVVTIQKVSRTQFMLLCCKIKEEGGYVRNLIYCIGKEIKGNFKRNQHANKPT